MQIPIIVTVQSVPYLQFAIPIAFSPVDELATFDTSGISSNTTSQTPQSSVSQ